MANILICLLSKNALGLVWWGVISAPLRQRQEDNKFEDNPELHNEGSGECRTKEVRESVFVPELFFSSGNRILSSFLSFSHLKQGWHLLR